MQSDLPINLDQSAWIWIYILYSFCNLGKVIVIGFLVEDQATESIEPQETYMLHNNLDDHAPTL